MRARMRTAFLPSIGLALTLASCAGRCDSRATPDAGTTAEKDAGQNDAAPKDAAQNDAPPKDAPPKDAPPKVGPDCTSIQADAAARARAFCASHSCADVDGLEASLADQTSKVADLDGDGVPEIVVGFGTPMVTESYLYRGGPRCRHLGTLEGGGSLERAVAKSEGHADFTLVDHGMFCQGSPCGCQPRRSLYRYRGGAYAEVPERRVEGRVIPCPDSPR